MAVRPISRFALVLLLCACGSSDAPRRLLWVGKGGQPVPASMTGNLFFVEADVDGKRGPQVVLDTGAPIALLAPSTFPGGGVPSGAGRIPSLTLGGVTLWKVPSVGDDASVAAFGVPAGFGGLLGYTVLGQFTMGFDYRHKDVSFGFPASLPGETASPPTAVPFALEGGGVGEIGKTVVAFDPSRIVVHVTIEGTDHELLLDTGASLFAIRQSIYDKLVSDGRGTATEDVGLESGVSTSHVTRLRSVVVGGAEVKAIAALSGAGIDSLADGASLEVGHTIDGLLGATYLRQFYVSIDYDRRTVSLYPYTNLDHIHDEYQRVGVGLAVQENAGTYAYSIAAVFPNTDAARQGIAVGSPLTQIDGMALGAVSPDAVEPLLFGAVGSTHTLTLGTRTLTVKVDELLPLP